MAEGVVPVQRISVCTGRTSCSGTPCRISTGTVAPADDDVIPEITFFYLFGGYRCLICIAVCALHLDGRIVIVPERDLVGVNDDGVGKFRTCYLCCDLQWFVGFHSGGRCMHNSVTRCPWCGSRVFAQSDRIPLRIGCPVLLRRTMLALQQVNARTEGVNPSVFHFLFSAVLSVGGGSKC